MKSSRVSIMSTYFGITTVNSFTDKVGKVERIADVRHPAEKIREAYHAHTVWHINDWHKIFPERRLWINFRIITGRHIIVIRILQHHPSIG